jgi:glutamine synthetase
MSEIVNTVEIFGMNVFNDEVMSRRLPKNIYKELKKTIENGADLSSTVADVVASAMRDGPSSAVLPTIPTGSSR